MKNKLCLLLFLIIFSHAALAEYYLVYSPPHCVDCIGPFPPYEDYYPNHYRVHKVRHSYHAVHRCGRHYKRHVLYTPVAQQLYVEPNTCGQCATCSCNGSYAISTSQPEYPGEHCTTYEDELQGQDRAYDY